MGITRIATCKVNGVNARSPVLLRWLAETPPTSSACRS